MTENVPPLGQWMRIMRVNVMAMKRMRQICNRERVLSMDSEWASSMDRNCHLYEGNASFLWHRYVLSMDSEFLPLCTVNVITMKKVHHLYGYWICHLYDWEYVISKEEYVQWMRHLYEQWLCRRHDKENVITMVRKGVNCIDRKYTISVPRNVLLLYWR